MNFRGCCTLAYISGGAEDISAIRREITELNREVDEFQIKAERLPQQINTFRTAERIVSRYLLLVRRAGLPEDAQQLIDVGSRIVIVFNQMYMAGTMLFSSPAGALLGIAGIALAQLSLMSSMEGY